MASEKLFGELPQGWQYLTLGEVCSQGGGSVQTGPFGSQLHKADYVPVGIPSIMPQNIGENRIIEEAIARITLEDAERLSRYRVRPGDIVYSRRGDVEKRAVIREAEDGWLCGTGCLRVRLGDDGPDPSYAAFYLGHPLVRGWVVRHAHGATMPNLNTAILSACPFVVPPEAEQRAIAATLAALDDKIDLNRRMNETLEQTARTLFKDWFVDFGPTRAKTAGQKPYLLEKLWALFPERLDGAGMPEGWKLSAVGNEINTLLGGTPSRNKAEYWGGTIPWINSGKANDFRVMSPSEYITDAGLRNSATKLLPPRTTIVAITGATLGQVSLTEIEACANQSVVGLLGSPPFPSEFIYFWVRENVSNLLASQTGGAQQHINKNDVNRLPLLKVERPLMDTYIDCVRPMFDGIKANEVEARTLAQTRDLLLPKLISGEMRVTEAAARVAEVI